MNIDEQLGLILAKYCDDVVINRRQYAESGKDNFNTILQEAKSALKKLINEASIEELSSVYALTNSPAHLTRGRMISNLEERIKDLKDGRV